MTYRLVLLIEIVHISIQNLDKQLDGRGRFHARVCDAEGPLETLQDALPVTVQLRIEGQ